MLSRILWNWRLHGLPRCDAYFVMSGEVCGRLIWPWQAIRGPATVGHKACREREEAEFDSYEHGDYA